MKIKLSILMAASLVFLQNSYASDGFLNQYQYPFKGEVIVRMSLSDICDSQKTRNTIINRGIPESSPQFKMMVDILASQCAVAKNNHLDDSVAFDVKGNTLLEVFDQETADDITLFQITLRKYETQKYLDIKWSEIARLKNSNTENDIFILVKGRYNSAASYMQKNNVVIQIDMMQTNGETHKSLSSFSTLYGDWLLNKN